MSRLTFINAQGKAQYYSQEDFSVLINQFANFLRQEGVGQKEVVLFYLPRIPELYFGVWGALKAGSIAGTLFPAYGRQAVLERLNKAQTKVLVTNRQLYARLKPLAVKTIIIDGNFRRQLSLQSPNFASPKVNPDDPALVMFTSATGDTPVCGIVLPQKALPYQQKTAEVVLGLGPKSNYWCTADPGWITGLIYGIITPWLTQTNNLIFEGRFSTEAWLSIIEKQKINLLYTSPTALRMLKSDQALFSKYNLSSLTAIFTVGEYLDPAVYHWAKKAFGVEVYDTWWQTETGAIMIANRPGLKVKAGSMGKPILNLEAKILNHHLVFKPNWPSLMTAIYGKPTLYQSYFRKGWYDSGDRARKDKEGYFWFIGRPSDLIKTAGERISCLEVEKAINAHPKVVESAVIGLPDKVRGEIIKAFIVAKEKINQDEVMDFVKKTLAGHAYPREIVFVDKLPKNPAGKILRKLLKTKK